MFEFLTSHLRIRRIKCGEEKPSCLKCKSTGRVCDGYSAAQKPPDTSGSDNQPILGPSTGSKALTRTIMHNDREYRAFHFFRSQTAPQLSSAIDSSFWDSLILQISHDIPAVRHAVIALGSLGERLDINHVLTIDNSEANKRHEFALIQYHKAIGELRRQLSSEQGRATESALICCFMFICFEFLQGNDTGALTHLQSGLDIIRRTRARPIKIKTVCHLSPCSDRGDFWSNSTQLFGLLDSTAALWIGEKLLQRPNIEDSETYIPVPRKFSDLQEAVTSFAGIVNQVMYLQETVNGPPYEALPIADLQAAAMKQEYLISQFESWLSLFQSLLKRPREDFSIEDTYQITLLKINFLIFLMKLAVIFEVNEETVYDRYDTNFEEIISHSTSLLQPVNVMPNVKIIPWYKNPFTFDQGVIQPLYFTATKCCNRKICSKAISLLSATPWREGAWESTSMAKIAKRTIRRREEEGFYNR